MTRAIDAIRAATQPLHERLDQLPYARAVLDGSVPIARYASFLRALHVVHAALEQAIELSGESRLKLLFGEAVKQRALLESDLAALRVDPHQVDPAALAALVMAQRMRLEAGREPDQLLGYLYVLAGSQLGGLVQHAALAQRPELAHGGLRYLAGQGRDTRARFTQFLARLDEGLTDQTTIAGATRGAVAAFEGFHTLLDVLAPDMPDSPWLVRSLNEEAGTHAISDDLREVEAALQAGEASFRKFAYYGARYGERGLRYTRSDSAWLATLVREDRDEAMRHLHWLGRVLSARGMPRLLLELHLGELARHLSARLPERAPRYAALDDAAALFARERTEALSDARGEALAQPFLEALAPEQTISPREAATLLVAALADERRGIAHAVSSLTSWLADPARFSGRWVQNVEALVERGRAALR